MNIDTHHPSSGFGAEQVMQAWAEATPHERRSLDISPALDALRTHRESVVTAMSQEPDAERRRQLGDLYDGIGVAEHVLTATTAAV